MSGGTADPTHVYWDLENRKGLWARGEAMSETPQSVLEQWLERREAGPWADRLREAIRAVLDLVRVQYEANEEMTRLLSAAETEVERLRAALEEVRGLTKCASDVFLIQISSVAAQALHLDWRDGGVKP